ncbi:MAG: transglycosylase domain-containing protein, partial [Rhodothermales bacterium]
MPLLQSQKNRWLWGLLLPVVFAASLAWPVKLDRQEPARSVQITDRDGRLLREIRTDGRGRPVRLGAISPAVVEALIATEDRHFYRHPGVNPLALGRAAWMNTKAGRVVSGGSTITMQVARVLRGRQGASLGDKLAEMHLALRLELWLSKKEILALWLERVPFGNETHGIEAAAHLYFDKAARDLTMAEAAFLVGLPQSPSRYNPFRHPERARARQHRVLQAMERNGVLRTSEQQRLEKLPVDLAAPQAVFRAPHLTSAIAASLPANDSVSEVRTTLDGVLQQKVEDLAEGHLARLRDASVTNAAVLVLDNATGEVLAYVGSADFWDVRA